MQIPSLAVLTPTFNRAHLLGRVFESIINNNFIKQWIIVDDGSSDKTYLLVQELKVRRPKNLDIIYIYRPNRGMKGAMNTGIPYLETKYFCKIDSDDYLSSNFGEDYTELFKQIEKHGEANQYNIISMKCKDENNTEINRLSNTLETHKMIKNAYVINYATDRLYSTKVSGDLLDIFPVDPAKDLFRYPYLDGLGHCPTGILHMFYVLMHKNRKQILYDKVGQIKEYRDGGITKSKANNLQASPHYYLMSSIMELSLPNHNMRSMIRSIRTFGRAGLKVIEITIKRSMARKQR